MVNLNFVNSKVNCGKSYSGFVRIWVLIATVFSFVITIVIGIDQLNKSEVNISGPVAILSCLGFCLVVLILIFGCGECNKFGSNDDAPYFSNTSHDNFQERENNSNSENYGETFPQYAVISMDTQDQQLCRSDSLHANDLVSNNYNSCDNNCDNSSSQVTYDSPDFSSD